jgi:hypothetical protein
MHTFEKTPPEVEELLLRPIKELGLKLEGSSVEKYVQQLYRELDQKGLKRFRPGCYLTDEWGCPSGEPIIGIPFYLADPKLAALEREMNDLEDEREIMMYLRHEAGHAFNYAYELYKTAEWRGLFGPFRRPYHDDYEPVPFSRKFVRHIAGWYAQKHPDEDFAETFAVWLTPRSGWRTKYRGWGAMRKLRYVDRVARRVGDVEPKRQRGATDVTVDEMETTIAEFYREARQSDEELAAKLPLDVDLREIFGKAPRGRRKKAARPAFELVAECRKAIVDRVAHWTGVRRPLVKSVVESIERRLRELGLVSEAARERGDLAAVTAYVTTLAMNYLVRGEFIATEEE